MRGGFSCADIWGVWLGGMAIVAGLRSLGGPVNPPNKKGPPFGEPFAKPDAAPRVE